MSQPPIISQRIHLISPWHGRPVWADIRWKADETPKPVVVFVHGFKGFKDWGPFPLVANRFVDAGFAFVKVNLSHNGTTPAAPTEFADLEAFGRNTFTKELHDLELLVDHLFGSAFTQHPFNLDRFYLTGHSRGGGISLIKAVEDVRIKGVATWAGISTLKMRYGDISLEEWERNGVVYIYNARTGQDMPLYYDIVEDLHKNTDRLDVEKAVRNLAKPLLIAHGTQDETLPLQMAHQLAQWHPEPQMLVVEEASHTFGGAHPWASPELPPHLRQVTNHTIRFFQSLGNRQ
jgi:uncharacterized protein